MNNFLNRFYFLAKLTTSLILLSLLLLISYLFVKSYLGQNDLAKNNLKIKDISIQLSTLSNIIEQNSSNINSIKNLVIENKESVKNISITLNELKTNDINDEILVQIHGLSDENNKIKDEIKFLLTTINNVKKISQTSNSSQQSEILINLIKLISLKLDNGEDFNEELKFLQNMQLNAGQVSNTEKLLILSSKKFLGLIKLNEKLNRISSDYLNEYYLQNEKNIFTKYLANLISIQPNLEENIQDNTVYLLAEAKRNLLEKKLRKSIMQLSSLNNGSTFFASWIKEAELYIETKDTINKFIK